MQFDIVDFDPSTEVRLLELYDGDLSASPYCHPLWLKLLGQATARSVRLVVAVEGGVVVAALPFLERRHAPGRWRMMEALPYDCYAYPLVDRAVPERDRIVLVEGIYRCLAAAGSVVRCFPPEWSGLVLPAQLGETTGLRPAMMQTIYIKTFHSLNDEDSLVRSYASHHRRKLNIFMKRNITLRSVVTRSELERFYSLVVETCHRRGIAPKFARKTVVEGGELMIASGLGSLWVAELAGRLCAGVFALRSKTIAVYWLGASSGEADVMRLAPMYGVMHQILFEAWQAGVAVVELGAAPTTGLRDFKSRWGTKPVRQSTYQTGDTFVLAALRARALIREVFGGRSRGRSG